MITAPGGSAGTVKFEARPAGVLSGIAKEIVPEEVTSDCAVGGEPPVTLIGTIVFGQILALAGEIVITGIGLTTTVAVMGVPGQPLATGVMVNVTVIGAAVPFVIVPLIFPLPLAAIPVTETVLSLVQL